MTSKTRGEKAKHVIVVTTFAIGLGITAALLPTAAEEEAVLIPWVVL